MSYVDSWDPLQVEGTVFQTKGNSKRDQDGTVFWACLRKSRDATAAKAEWLSRGHGDMATTTCRPFSNFGFCSGWEERVLSRGHTLTCVSDTTLWLLAWEQILGDEGRSWDPVGSILQSSIHARDGGMQFRVRDNGGKMWSSFECVLNVSVGFFSGAMAAGEEAAWTDDFISRS